MRDEVHHQTAYSETVFERIGGVREAIADRLNSLCESPSLCIDGAEPIQLAHLVDSERTDQRSDHTRGRSTRQTLRTGDCPGSWPRRA
jgi:hypothetical protein